MKKLAAIPGALVALVVWAQVAYAQTAPADPTGGAAETLKSDVSGWVTAHGVPLAIGLLFVGIVVGLLIKFGKRGAKAA